MYRTILLMICLLSVSATHAQRQRMVAEVHREYKDGRWQPVDSTVYEYIGSSGSVDMNRYEFAQGYDTRTAYRMDHGRYHPWSWRSIDYDSAGHPVLYTFQYYDHKKWINIERYSFDYSPRGDTLSYGLEYYDEKQKSWHTVQSALNSYDSLRRLVTHTLWGDKGHEPFLHTTMDSFHYDDQGRLTRMATLVWDTSIQWRLQEWKAYEYSTVMFSHLGKVKTELITKPRVEYGVSTEYVTYDNPPRTITKIAFNIYNQGGLSMESIVFDTAGRVLNKTSYDMTDSAIRILSDPSRYQSDADSFIIYHSKINYRYDIPGTVVVNHYEAQGHNKDFWKLKSTDSMIYDARNNILLFAYLDNDSEAIFGGQTTTTEYDSQGAFRSSVTSYLTGKLTTPGDKQEDTRDSHGLLTSRILSKYMNGRWEYQDARLYRYEPVPEK